MKWLSQYPHEEELCFPPLTCLQVIGTSVEGSVLVVSLRLNINLSSSTIYEVIGKRGKILKDMCMHLGSEVANELLGQMSDPETHYPILEVLEMALRDIHAKQIEYFNEDEQFQHSLKAALEWKKVALRAVDLVASVCTADAIIRYGALMSHARSCIECGSNVVWVVGLLLRLAQSPREEARRNVCASITSNGNLKEFVGLASAGGSDAVGKAMEFLTKVSEDGDTSVRQAACEQLAALALAGGPEAVGEAMELLPELVSDENVGVRWAACKQLAALGLAGSREVVVTAMELLPPLARDKNKSVCQAACKQLAALAVAGGSEVAGQAKKLLAEVAKCEVLAEVTKYAEVAEVAKAGSEQLAATPRWSRRRWGCSHSWPPTKAI